MKILNVVTVFILLFNTNAFATKVSNLISPVGYFVNHLSELQHLSAKLLVSKKVGITGVSGIGKTQLARMYANKNIDKYKIIWFFDCSIDLSDQFSSLAKELNSKICKEEHCNILESVSESQKSVLKFLSPRHDFLLVFDNIKTNQNNKIVDFVNNDYNGDIIFCSQDSSNLIDTVQLSYLSSDDSVLLAQKILGESSPNTSLDLANAFKGHPLLIASGAIFLKNNRYMNTNEYKQLIKNLDNNSKSQIIDVIQNLNKSARNLLCIIALVNNQRFSKDILMHLTKDNLHLSENIYNLKKFGLITCIDSSCQLFEMHDMIKDTSLKTLAKEEIESCIDNILDNLNERFPKNVTNKYLLLKSDPNFKSNLEILLQNVEDFEVSKHKIMGTRKNLLSLYLNSLDYDNCQKMKEWLVNQMKDKSFVAHLEKDKVAYAEYLIDIAVYEDFANSNHQESIKFLEDSKDIIGEIEGYEQVKFTVFSQLAQVYAFGGEINLAKENITEVEKLLKNFKDVDFDIGLYWFIKSKIYLLEGDYKSALQAIEKNIEAESHLPRDTFIAPTFIQQAEILNCLNQFKSAYEISSKIYEQETTNIKDEHEIHARILTQLARAELGLDKIKEAQDHINKAIAIYTTRTHNLNLDASEDTDFAAAFAVQAEVLNEFGLLDESFEAFKKAELLFCNRYKKNMKYLDNISALYLKAGLVFCKSKKHKEIYERYKNELIEDFGADHFRTKELIKECSY